MQEGHNTVLELLLDHVRQLDRADICLLGPAEFDVGHKLKSTLSAERRAQMEPPGKHGQTLSSYATLIGRKPIVKLLLEQGARIEARDEYDRAPLAHVAAFGHESIVQRLTEKGARLNPPDNTGRTPISLATGSGSASILELLLGMGAQIDAANLGHHNLGHQGKRRKNRLRVYSQAFA